MGNSYVCVEAFVTDKQLLDFSYGVMGALFNVGMGCITYLAGHVPVAHMPLVYAGSLIVGVILTCWLLLRFNPSDAAAAGLIPSGQPPATGDTLPGAQRIGASSDQPGP